MGDCYDTTVAESFFAALKVELLHCRVWPTRQEARLAIFEFIEGWYNRQRCTRLSITPGRSPYAEAHRRATAA